MFQELIYGMLGQWSRVVVEWSIANPLPVGIFFTTILAMWISGKYQFQRLEEGTEAYLLDQAPPTLAEDPNLSDRQLYDKLYPGWAKMVRKNAIFILHRWELWPLPATPDRVQDRLGYSPEWMCEFLEDNDFHVRQDPQSKKKLVEAKKESKD